MHFTKKLLKPKPGRYQRVAHRVAHRWEPHQVRCIEVRRSENVSDDQVVGKAGDGFLRLDKARGSSDSRNITARASQSWRYAQRRRTCGGYRVRVVVCRGIRGERFYLREKRSKKNHFNILFSFQNS